MQSRFPPIPFRRSLLVFVIAFSVFPVACSGDSVDLVDKGPAPPPPAPIAVTTLPSLPDLVDIDLVPVATGIEEPTALAPAPSIAETFIVGRLGILTTATSAGDEVVLDIEDRVGQEISEQGFLGFAVHPQFPQDPRGIAVYTNHDLDVIVASFDWNGETFDPATEKEILLVEQPHKYHQGGGVQFGPQGYLWLSFGDGGGDSDKYRNGQNPFTLKGTIVRIDIDHGDPYRIPPTNPFVDGDDGAQEAWAFGLRNPWRFWVDGSQILIADVGQSEVEEINLVSTEKGGYNFGWPVVEGDRCYLAATCTTEGFTAPMLALEHMSTCAIIGGVVYRGSTIPELHGQYVYGDYCAGSIHSVPVGDGALGEAIEWTPLTGTHKLLSTFGLDHNGELLMATLSGEVFRFEPIRAGS